MWVKRSTLEDMIPKSSFGTFGWQDDLSYLEKLSKASYSDPRVKEYMQACRVDENQGSLHALAQADKILNKIKNLGLPISTYRIQNKISQLHQVQVRLEEMLQKHKGIF